MHAGLRIGSRQVARGVPGRRGLATEIPIRQVARVFRAHVGNEANALQMDKHLQKMAALVATADGHVKTSRTVCKAEWAYEVEMVFKDLDSFKAYMGSELRERTLTPMLESAVAECVTDKEAVYMGARVFDEL